MRRRRRGVRGVAKWGVTGACAAFLAVWLISLKYSIVWCHVPPSGFGGTKIAAHAGTLGFVHFQPSTKVGLSPPGWEVRPREDPLIWRFLGRSASGSTFVLVPLWVPTALLAIPTALLWRFRPLRPGHCRCGYSRAGLGEGAACPECGVKAVRA